MTSILLGNMPELATPLWVVFGAFSSFSLFFGLGGAREYLTLRWLRNQPRRPIGDLDIGNALVEGEIVPIAGQLLRCPLSDADCVYYRIHASKPIGRGKSRAALHEQRHVVFAVQDGTGTVVVDLPRKRPVAETRRGYHLTVEEEQRLYQKFGFLPGGVRYRYTESILAPGDKVLVRGNVEFDLNYGMLQFRGHDLFVSNLGLPWHEQRYKQSIVTCACFAAFFAVGAAAAAYGLLLVS